MGLVSSTRALSENVINRFARSTGTFCTRSRYFFTRMPRLAWRRLTRNYCVYIKRSFLRYVSQQQHQQWRRRPQCACPAPIDKSQTILTPFHRLSARGGNSLLRPACGEDNVLRGTVGGSHLFASTRTVVQLFMSPLRRCRKRKQCDEASRAKPRVDSCRSQSWTGQGRIQQGYRAQDKGDTGPRGHLTCALAGASFFRCAATITKVVAGPGLEK